MADIQLGSLRLNVVASGQGVPILFVHGFPLDHRMWQPQLDEFVHTNRIIAPDLRGFGQSHVTQDTVSMDRFADDLAELLDALDVTEPVVFCGLSMGGYIGWSFFRRHRPRLRALVQFDTRAVSDTAEGVEGRHKMAATLRGDGAESTVRAMLPKLLSAHTRDEHPELVEHLRQMMLDQDPQGMAGAALGMAERADSRDLLPQIDVPTLLIVGEDDPISPPDEMQEMAAAIPGAAFHVIPCAAHLPPLENSEATNALLREFLGSLS